MERGVSRDIEFLVQGLQLIHGKQHPHLLKKSTLNGLSALSKTGILSEDAADILRTHYIFLRRIEHYLQLHEDRQTHHLPKTTDGLLALAKHLQGSSASVDDFMRALNKCRDEVRHYFQLVLH